MTACETLSWSSCWESAERSDSTCWMGFQRVTAHEIGHALGQAAHVTGDNRLMLDGVGGTYLKVNDQWQEYEHTYPYAQD